MAIKEQDVVLVAKDTSGNKVIQMPITRVENVEGAIKTINGAAPDDTLNVVINTVANATKATQDASGNVITATYATKTEVTSGLAGKANKSHTHTVYQITNMPKVILSVNDITPDDSGNVSIIVGVKTVNGKGPDSSGNVSVPAGVTPNAYVTETWSSGSNRYRVWSNEFIEQWGLLNGSGGGGTVQLRLTKKARLGNGLLGARAKKKTTSSISSQIMGGASDGAPNQSWYAAGF